jgi:hypothetical protein
VPPRPVVGDAPAYFCTGSRGIPVTFAIPDNFGRLSGSNGNRSWQIGVRYTW